MTTKLSAEKPKPNKDLELLKRQSEVKCAFFRTICAAVVNNVLFCYQMEAVWLPNAWIWDVDRLQKHFHLHASLFKNKITENADKIKNWWTFSLVTESLRLTFSPPWCKPTVLTHLTGTLHSYSHADVFLFSTEWKI